MANANHIGQRFGSIVVTRQYFNGDGKGLRVDYVCDCGNTTTNKSFYKIKTQKMCLKCRKTNAHKIIPDTSFNMLFSDYKRNARKRDIVFDLSKEDFSRLTKEKCFYCGEFPISVRRPNATAGSYVYSGIDRKNNGEGYVIGNCVPCCKICNFSKHNLAEEDFLNHVRKIYEYQFVENKR